MKISIIKRLMAGAIIVCILVVSSCGGADESKETLLPSFSAKYDGYEFFEEKFTFLEHSNPEREDTPIKEKTGYRLARREIATGEVKCACVDPACLHTIDSECPVVCREGIGWIRVNDNSVFFICNPSISNWGEKSVLKCYDLDTGRVRIIFEEDNDDAAQDSYELGEKCVFYCAPDIVAGKTVYTVNRYDLITDSVTQIVQSKDPLWVYLVTNQRVYVGLHPLSFGNPEDNNIMSYEYDGQNERKEPPHITDICLTVDNSLYSNIHLDIGTTMTVPSAFYIRYNITSREMTPFPLSGEAIASMGYCKSENRIYYLANEGAEYFTTLNPFTLSKDLGISYEEFISDTELVDEMWKKLNWARYETKSYLKSCNPDGSDEKVVYEFPAGTYMHINGYNGYGKYEGLQTGSLSEDGTLYYVVLDSPDENGQPVYRSAAIRMDTGEIIEME